MKKTMIDGGVKSEEANVESSNAAVLDILQRYMSARAELHPEEAS